MNGLVWCECKLVSFHFTIVRLQTNPVHPQSNSLKRKQAISNFVSVIKFFIFFAIKNPSINLSVESLFFSKLSVFLNPVAAVHQEVSSHPTYNLYEAVYLIFIDCSLIISRDSDAK